MKSRNHLRFGRKPAAFLAILLLLDLTNLATQVNAQTPPINDNFANATVLNGTNLNVGGSNVNATKEPGEPDHAGSTGGKSIWWSWQAPADGYVTVSTSGSISILYGNGDLDTVLGVYTGSSVANLTEITSNDDGPNDVTSQASFRANAGTVYHIAVDGYSYDDIPADTDAGIILLSLNFSTGLPAAPSWALPAVDGSTLNSTNFSGKVVVLNFWATWCGPCIAETPDLIALQQKYAPDGLSVVGISLDSSPDGSNPPSALVDSFIAYYGVNYPVAMADPFGYSIVYAYGGVPYIPNTFIIDRQNHIAQSFVGTQTYATFETSVIPLLYADLTLTVSLAGGRAHVSWPVKQANFVVESTPNIAGHAWTKITEPIQSDGVHQFADVSLGAGPRYFRLHYQPNP